ncbi:DUF4249 domain-containing protein [Arsenicibacter rosenii]|uniref:DUF4249 domain-containing protein n=1 Tax=Arsenicibacter rosenii TaxID=1750698 RepID=A0A1S2VFQ7_9BACT|nr:DUF4249 domain-containing protein [Arsenicibacter rosenii]OIN57544.1 hypothetical protein BLX24_18820 [Arsenicibacter rosenii]
MKRKHTQQLIGWLFILIMGGCVDPYRPPEITAPATYLVVDGFLDIAPGAVTTFKLSRSQNLTDAKAPTMETKATVTIESSRNLKYSLKEVTSGVYSYTSVPSQTGETFRLRIKTSRGVEYLSDMVAFKNSPVIDQVNWKVENDGVRIYADAHDPTGNTRYYRWEYEETWEFTSAFYSSYEVKNKQIVQRQQDIFTCWNSAKSKNILINSSAKLNQDVISQMPITYVPGYSTKIGVRYSILVKQYALTQDAYLYWEQLSKTTENIGSLFDPQPTQVTGNIQNLTNPAEPALGYFSAGTVTSKRMFIRRMELPYWVTKTGYDGCVKDTLTPKELIDNKYPGQIPITDLPDGTYETGQEVCVDCRLQGTNVKPSFWNQ